MKSVSARLASLDLNLLVILRELLRERNVTRAADRVGMSQPAASAALSRLRRYFDDDLLLRRGGRYELSALAQQLAEQVETVCDGIERLLATGADSSPLTSRREFKVVMSDYVIAVLGQRLAGLMNTVAAQSRLNIVLVRESLAANIAHTIRIVDCVVATATSRFRVPEMRSTALFEDRWVCVVSADHWRLDEGPLTLDDLRESTWVVPYHSDTDFPSAIPVSRQLSLLGIRPSVAVRVDSYQAVPYLLAGTDRVALMQERLARSCAVHLPLRVLECPRRLEPIAERLWWHERLDDDPAHRWFRQLVVRAARTGHDPP